MPNDAFKLRPLQPSDSSPLVKLISDFDGDMITQFHVDAYTALLDGLENRTLGVGVECNGFDGLVGLGTVRFGQVQFNGEILPLAFLDGLKVHKDFRGQGLGYRIASWRIQQAREAYGDRCVIATGMLSSNAASRAVAKKWCREFIDTAFLPMFYPVRASRPPRPQDGIIVREVEPGEFAEFALKQNTYHQNHNLYPPDDVQSITHASGVAIGDKKLYHFYTAIDPHGSLLAGVKIWCRALIKSDRFQNPPAPLRILNKVAHVLPPDFIIRDAGAIGLWHEPGQEKAARYLWDCLSWELKGQANTLALSLDPHDPLRQVLPTKPAFMPRIEITFAVHGPAPIDREQLLFGYGRV